LILKRFSHSVDVGSQARLYINKDGETCVKSTVMLKIDSKDVAGVELNIRFIFISLIKR